MSFFSTNGLREEPKKYTINTLEGKSNWLEGELSSPWGVRYQSNSLSSQIKWNPRPFKSRGLSV
ncbi:MAG: hypothetical protein R6V14_03625 [Halanaerobiales bacterium]